MSKIIFSVMLMFLLISPAYAQDSGLTSPTESRVKYDDNGIAVPKYDDNGITVPSPEESGLTSPTETEKADVMQEGEVIGITLETGTGTDENTGVKAPQIFPQKVREAVRGFVERVRSELTPEAVPSFVTQKREAYTVRIQEHRETMEQKQAEIQGRVDQQRLELKERLQIVQSEQKQRVVERIDEQLVALNKRMTNHFLHVLEQIEAVVTNIETRTDRAVERGLDIGAVHGAINTAYGVIEASRAEIMGQAGIIYVIEIESEETLKINVGAVRQALHNNLKNVRDTVRAAHDATRSAAVTLAQIPHVDDVEIEAEEEEELETQSETE